MGWSRKPKTLMGGGIIFGLLTLVFGVFMAMKVAKAGFSVTGASMLWGGVGLAGFIALVYFASVFSPVVGLLTALAFGVPASFFIVPALAQLLTAPISSAYTGGESEAPRPFYSAAIGLRKRGDTAGALALIAEQRSRFPDDLQGALLEADIRRRDRRDPDEARDTLLGWLAGGARPTSEASQAWRELAEIAAEKGDLPEAERWLTEIAVSCAGTSAAEAAGQRLAHLAAPGAAREVGDALKLEGKVFARDIGLRSDHGASLAVLQDPQAERRRLEIELVAHPDNWDTTEALARLEAEQDNYGRATELLESLASLTTPPARVQARWLNLLADLHVSHGSFTGARGALTRIGERFPATALASLADARIRMLPLDARGRRLVSTIPQAGRPASPEPG